MQKALDHFIFLEFKKAFTIIGIKKEETPILLAIIENVTF